MLQNIERGEHATIEIKIYIYIYIYIEERQGREIWKQEKKQYGYITGIICLFFKNT